MTDIILSKMTLEEKIALCSGKNFWETKSFPDRGIPSVFMCDGPHGLRKQENAADMLGVNHSRKATCFPAEVTTANSWDEELLCRIGSAIAQEAKNQKVGMVLGPGANIKRNPLCGRNFEYFSEDPYLTGKLAAAYIRGVEGKGVAASIKHFACNSQEKERFVSDSVIDERSLRELYLTGFEIAVKEGKPSTLMCAYPKLNGVHCSDNERLLTGILRDEWGFKGAVITDWGAMNDRIEGFRAGCDLNMPGGAAYMEQECVQAVREGRLTEEAVNSSAERVLRLVLRGSDALTGESCDYAAHHELCREAAISGAVLLQNTDGLLPVKENTKLALIGYMAKTMRYQGAGSSHINPAVLSQPIDYFPNCEYAPGCDENGDTSAELLSEVRTAAEKSEACVVFVGLPDSLESEGFDRMDMSIPQGHIDMLLAAAEVNPNTVAVLLSGSAVECPWADKVKSVLYMGLPGQAGAEAIAELLFGRAVPSGKLAESWPYSYEDVPSSEIFGKTRDALYEEGLYVGYRYYDKAGVPVRFPFGFGLSYTQFEYSDLSVDGDTVSVTVSNTGEYDAAEVVQLYVCPPQDGIHRPLRELKGFRKIYLKRGESRSVSFELNDRCFSVYNDGWKLPAGTYEIQVGELSVSMVKSGETVPIPAWQRGSFYEDCKGKPDKTEWEKLLGRSYEPASETKKGSYTMENSVEEMRKHSAVMKIMYAVIEKMFLKSCGGDRSDPNYKMLMASSVGAPLRSMYISGGMANGVFPGLLEMANGRFFRGIIRMIKR